MVDILHTAYTAMFIVWTVEQMYCMLYYYTPPFLACRQQYFLIRMLKPHHTRTVLWPFFWDHEGESVPEEDLWTWWCKGRLREADTPTIQLGATPARLSSAHLHHPPCFLQAWCPSCRPTNRDAKTGWKLKPFTFCPKWLLPGNVYQFVTSLTQMSQWVDDSLHLPLTTA